MKIFPIRDQVVVTKEKEKEERSPGGIITVSISSSGKFATGKVVAVGSGKLTVSGTVIPLEVQAGDTVLFNPSMANEVTDDTGTFLVLREDALTVLR